MAVPCPLFKLCKHIPHLVLDKRRVDLRREKVEGERGEDGLEMEERWKNLGLFFVLVLHWSFGLSGADSDGGGSDCSGGGGVDGEVRQRSRGLETG